jgi:hypothetical protein
MIRCYSKTGDILWEKMIGNYRQSLGLSIEFAADSGLIICGGVQVNQGEDYHALLVRTDRDGNIFGTGISDLSETGFTCWPNPASGVLHFRLAQPVPVVSVEITDLTGQIQIKANIRMEAGNGKINIEALPEGIYLLKIRNGDTQPVIRKFIVKREG